MSRFEDLTVGKLRVEDFGLLKPRHGELALAIASAGVRGAASDPTWVAITGTGIYVRSFTNAATKEVFFVMKIPPNHGIGDKYDSEFKTRGVNDEIELAIDWAPTTTNTGVCRWGFEYLQMAPGVSRPAAAVTVYAEEAANGEVERPQHTTFAKFPASSMDATTMGICRLFRDGTHANDTFTGDALGLFIHVAVPVIDVGGDPHD